MTESQFLDEIKLNQGIIYKLVALFAQDPEEKKDLYQEILLQAWKGQRSFRHESKFSTWLYRICLNTIFTHRRKARRFEGTDSLDTLATSVNSYAARHEDVSRLRIAIRQLPETDRAIISMNLDGYDNKELAEILGISANHVAVKLHRIKQILGTLLTQ